MLAPRCEKPELLKANPETGGTGRRNGKAPFEQHEFTLNTWACSGESQLKKMGTFQEHKGPTVRAISPPHPPFSSLCTELFPAAGLAEKRPHVQAWTWVPLWEQDRL
jgi:hypothetical protein